jgi:hypothetical protein
MTAVEAPERPRRLRFLHRHVAGQVGSDVAATATALSKSQATLLSGQYVRWRFVQMLAWSVVAGLIGAQFIFGLYDGITQVNWYVHVGPVHFEIFYLKPSWDKNCFGLVHSAVWPLYRHLAFRDIAGAALATMAVQTLLSKPKWWSKRVSTLRIVTGPLVIIVLTFGLGVLGVYLAYFGLPDLWHAIFSAAGHPGFKVNRLTELSKLSVNPLLIGFAIGRVLHRYWAPIGATLQGSMLDRSVDRWQDRITKAGMDLNDAVDYSNRGLHILPRWEYLPVVPPVLRERFALMWGKNVSINVRSAHGRVILAVTVFFALVTLLGFVGHYVAGEGISVPYLFPGA